MSTQSKPYPVRSNAARAATQYGLTRADTRQIEGGAWVFDIPEGVTPIKQPKKVKAAAPATDTPAGDVPAPAKRSRAEAAANVRKARAAAKAEKAASKAAKSKAKPAKAKPAKAKKSKAAKAKKPKAAKKAKATGPKRKAGAKSGVVAGVIAELKARWTPAKDILKRTGWVSNTFRGILGAHKKKTGEAFERKRDADGVTHYRIAA